MIKLHLKFKIEFSISIHLRRVKNGVMKYFLKMIKEKIKSLFKILRVVIDITSFIGALQWIKDLIKR